MKKKITSAAVIVVLLLSFLISSAQPEIDHYYIVTLKGNIVSNTLNTYPEFSYFDFTYTQVSNNDYALSGYAKDEQKNQLGSLITLIPMTSHPPRLFKNLEKGHLYLDKATMEENNVDGSQDYVLTPKKCKDRSDDFVDYVSYRFSNKIEPSTGFLPAKSIGSFKSFNLNPSPPY